MDNDIKFTEYEVEYLGVKCLGVRWNYQEGNIFYFVYGDDEFYFTEKNEPAIDCNADTDHIRSVIELQFLPFYKELRREDLKKENAELKARLEKAVELPVKVGDIRYAISYDKTCVLELEVVAIECVVMKNGSYSIATITCEQNRTREYLGFDRWNGIYLTREAAEARLKELEEQK